MTQPSLIHAIIFDFDDTLIDWSRQIKPYPEIYRFHLENLYTFLSETGHTLPPIETFVQQYQEVVRHAWDEAKIVWAGVNFATVLKTLFRALALDLSQIDIQAAMQAFNWQPVPNVAPFADTHATLQTLKQQGYQLGLITNSMMPMWMRDIELRAYELIDYFDGRLTSGDFGHMKPHPAIYHELLRQLGCRPEQAIFVGDRPANDIAGANDAGMISVLMSPPHVIRDLNGVQPDYTIETLQDLLPILAALEGA
ncbi:MAG: HAD family hydrolase [Ardenticatenaceae bacterium]|nr:HAD family hydrolase [Anaerolineales bacterium]MCB8923337.1 HAD family hydrolase [Ardenticatenaceae bacterium]MCB9004663.1 HAD family hydrolase [Ardenticatenaceae bacterium]